MIMIFTSCYENCVNLKPEMQKNWPKSISSVEAVDCYKNIKVYRVSNKNPFDI